jgi:tetratricopeptide (TPR) repeat protein
VGRDLAPDPDLVATEVVRLLSRAEDALALAQVDPRGAGRLAVEVLDRTWVLPPSEAAAVAERALGLVARELDDIEGAVAHLTRSVELGLAVGGARSVRAAQARMSLSLALAYAGRSEEALAQAELAAPALSPVDRARLDMQRALVLQRLGRLDEALEGYRRALRATRRLGDRHGEARILTNRGVLNALRGDFRAAEADLSQAAALFDELGQVLYAAKARHNIGFACARRGDIPAALTWYERAEVEYRRLGISEAIALVDRCEALLSVRLIPEAVATATRAVDELAARGMQADLGPARLLLAEAVLLDGRPADSAHLAELARRSFVAQHRPGWAAWASYACLRAAWAGGDRTLEMLELATRTVEDLAASGWAGPATDVRLITAEIALAHGRMDRAEQELAATRAARRSGPAELRARIWHAEALLRHARGDARGTETALRTGMRILAQHQATLGATELRVYAGSRNEDLARMGLRLALASGRLTALFAWTERARAGALRWPAVLPPHDKGVASSLAELRHVVALLEESGRAARNAAPLLRRQAEIEARIRAQTWGTEGSDHGPRDSPPRTAAISQALGSEVLVELVEVDDELLALVLARRRLSLHRLGPIAAVDARIRVLRFALQRLARRNVAASVATKAFVAASETLDTVLLRPLRPVLLDRAVVIVPTGACHALPWSTLPSLRDRPVSVSPSAALWLKAASASTSGRRTVLVSGPGLVHGADEVAQLSRLYPDATVLTGGDATTSRLGNAVLSADLLHVAAHGTFRADNPLFSSLRLADGPLTVYDLERLPRLPRRIILSACDAGESAVTSSDELIGVSSALLSLGAQTLVASVVSVSDEVTMSLMVEFHRRLRDGRRPAEALASAQAALGTDDEMRARAGGFLCFGAG